jgi:hypothetical protein
VLFRKASTVILATIVEDPYTQTMCAILLLATVLVVHIQLQPFTERRLNNLETMSLMTLLVTQTLCIMYLHVDYRKNTVGGELNAEEVASQFTVEVVLTVVLTMINVGVLLVLLMNFLSGYVRECFEACQCCACCRCVRATQEKKQARIRKRTVDGWNNETFVNPLENVELPPWNKPVNPMFSRGEIKNDDSPPVPKNLVDGGTTTRRARLESMNMKATATHVL